MRILLLLALASCTYDEKVFQGAFDCLNDPPPTTANDIVTVQGQAVDAASRQPLAGVSLSFLDRNMNPISSATTGATGAFEFSIPTNGTPVDHIYLKAEGAGRFTTFYTNERPLTKDVTFEYRVASTEQATAISGGGLGMPFTPGTGTVLTRVEDCNNTLLEGATVTSTPGGDVRYFDGVQPSMDNTQTDTGGVAMIANLPMGTVSVTATVDGMVFPTQTFLIAPDAFVQTVMVP